MSEDCRPSTSIILKGVRDSGCSLGDEIFISFSDRSEVSITLTGVGYSDFFFGDEIALSFVDDLDGNISTTFRYRIVGIGWTSEGDSVELKLRKKVEGE